MRVISAEVFDDLISTTGPVWLSGSQFNAAVGAADLVVIQACTRAVTGTLPTLTVQAQHSADNQNWVNTQSVEISGLSISNDLSLFAVVNLGAVRLAYLRFQISLGGTSPQCRLRLYATGRSHAGTS